MEAGEEVYGIVHRKVIAQYKKQVEDMSAEIARLLGEQEVVEYRGMISTQHSDVAPICLTDCGPSCLRDDGWKSIANKLFGDFPKKSKVTKSRLIEILNNTRKRAVVKVYDLEDSLQIAQDMITSYSNKLEQEKIKSKRAEALLQRSRDVPGFFYPALDQSFLNDKEDFGVTTDMAEDPWARARYDPDRPLLQARPS